MLIAKLCLYLKKTRKQLLNEMDSDELTWWLAVNRVMPIPRPWEETALTCSTIANFAGKTSKGKIKVEDYMPKAFDWKSHKANFQMYAVGKGKNVR